MDPTPIEETYELSEDDFAAAAIALARIEADAFTSAIDEGALGRVDAFMDRVGSVFVLVVLIGGPLVVAGVVFAVTRDPWLGLGIAALAVVGPVGRVLWRRGWGAAEARFDAATDRLIDRSAAATLRKRIASGRLRIPAGRVTARLDGDGLTVEGESGSPRVTVSIGPATATAATATHRCFAERRLRGLDDLADVAVVPADGPIAAAAASRAG